MTVPAGRASGRRAVIGKTKFTSRVHIRRDASAALSRRPIRALVDWRLCRAACAGRLVYSSACPAVAFTGAVAERCSSILIRRPSAARTRKLDRKPKPFSPHVSLEKCPLASSCDTLSSVGQALLDRAQELPQIGPIGWAQIAGHRLLDRNPNVIRD